MPEYMWDVIVSGEDIPTRITTDYLNSEREEIVAGGGTWTVERVEIGESVEHSDGSRLRDPTVRADPLPPPSVVLPLDGHSKE